MDAERLLGRVALQLAVSKAQLAAVTARTRHGTDALALQALLVEAIRAQRSDLEDADAGDRRGVDEMAINEICVLADLAATAGHSENAASLFAEAGTIAAAHDALLWARVDVDHAIWRRDQTEYAAALELLFGARDRLEAVGSLPAQPQINAAAKVAATLAETLRWLDDFGRAARALRDARRGADILAQAAASRADRLENWFRSQDLARLRFEAVLLFIESGRWRFAEAAFPAVEEYFDSVGPLGTVTRELYRTRIEAGLGRTAAALARLDTVLPAFMQEPWLAGKRGVVTLQRAKLLAALDRDTEALQEARKAAAFEAAALPSDTAWQAFWEEARLMRAVEGAAASLPAFDRAIAAIDASRRASLGLRLDSLFLRRRRPVIDTAIIAAAEVGDAARCASFADVAKSRFLAAALHAGPPGKPPPSQLDLLDALNTEVDQGAAGDQRRLRAARATLLERMRLSRGALSPPPHEPQTIADQLAARNQAALQLFVTNDNQLVTVLLHDGDIVRDIRPLGAAARRGLDAYAANLALPPEYQSSSDWDPAALIEDAGALAAPALIERALGADALIVAPHSSLNIVPWPALRFAGRRLFEWTPIAQVPALAAIPALAGRPPAATRLAIFGDPHSERHGVAERGADLAAGLAAIEAACGAGCLVLPPVTKQEAKVASFRTLAASAELKGGMLHLACHGRFEADDPDGAGLVVADRVLTAAEIALYPLAAREVTLAACSTGVRPARAAGVRLRGDDVVGLPGAFLEAGAASVLVSVTPTGDHEAAAFFRGYYARRLGGALPLAAVAGTQRALLGDPSLKFRRWAGFTLYGVA